MMDGVEMATVYAFSTENWNRDPLEVSTLMTIFAKYAETFVTEALKNNVKVNILSTGTCSLCVLIRCQALLILFVVCCVFKDFEKLPPKVQSSVNDLEMKTCDCSRFTLNICLSYGGRKDILTATKYIADAVLNGKVSAEEINEELFSEYLVTGKKCDRSHRRLQSVSAPSKPCVTVPDPEVLIRTSGEFRLSNFLSWQVSYFSDFSGIISFVFNSLSPDNLFFSMPIDNVF
jgi:undecaprenyl diphosphate synthase